MIACWFNRWGSPLEEGAVAPPLVIGALGGSGTRALSKIVRHAGCWMGNDIDERTEDALAMRAFLKRWFVPLLDYPDMPARRRAAAEREFLGAMATHRRGIDDASQPWGWKNPRNMWLLRFYLKFYPDLKFLHLLRDGRDMALSKNLYLLEQHGDYLVGRRWRKDPVDAQFSVWLMGNERAGELARECASGNYLRVRYEDVCTQPQVSARQVFQFLNAGQPPASVVREIEPSSGIGRWQAAPDGHLVHRPPLAVRVALEEYGYESRRKRAQAA
jgi:hypothetical protein